MKRALVTGATRGIGRSLVFQARALSILGKDGEAITAARKAFVYSLSAMAGMRIAIAKAIAAPSSAARRAEGVSVKRTSASAGRHE